MSVSSLPEWKQLLLERKRREEEEREKREKEEEAKLASMPAWKRGIIQRRRKKLDSYGDKEREGPQVKEGRSPSDAVSDPDSSTLVQVGSEPPLSPDATGLWLDEEAKPQSQVLMETITPVHQNPFIRTHGGWRRGREAEKAGETGHEKGNYQEIEVGREREKEKEKSHVKGYDGESGRVRDIEIRIERYRDRSAGREMSQDAVLDKERECPRGKKEEEREEGDSDPPSPKYPHPQVPGLRTIRADNIIIIEQDRKGSDERRGRRRDLEKEMIDDEQEKRGVKMDLRELLAGGGSVTEIRASEVLIIKPLAGAEDCRSGGLKGTGREGDGERGRAAKCSKDGRKDCEGELEREVTWRMTKDKEREKDRPWTQSSSEKLERKFDADDGLHNERGVRVSELLSKFGEHTKKFREHPKLPSRSKSSECFIRLDRDSEMSGLDKDDCGGENNLGFRGVPKRSFSFSDRVKCAKENGMKDEGNHDKMVARTYSDRRVAPWRKVMERECSEKSELQGGWTWLSDKEQARKLREGCKKAEREVVGGPERQPSLESMKGKEIDHGVGTATSVESGCSIKATAELNENMYGEAGFTMASVKNTEASFARRVSIKHDGRERAVEMDVKRMKEENERWMERAKSTEREVVIARQAEPQMWERRSSDFRRGSDVRRVSDVRDCTISVETTPQNCVITLSVDRANPPQSADSQYRHVSTFTECSTTLLSTVAHRGTGHHSSQSPLSHYTEDLINKMEKFGETANERDSHKGTQTSTQEYKGMIGENIETVRVNKAFRGPGELSKDIAQPPGADVHSHLEKSVQEVTLKCPKSPKCVTSLGVPPTPLDIHIPTTVFYGVGETLEKKRPSLHSEDEDQSCEGEGGKDVERRDSWRIGKPLSRIESLREKIRQREEKLRNMEGASASGDEEDAPEGMDKAAMRWARRASSLDKCEEGEQGSQMERERQRQESSAPQTIPTQEVSVSKAGPQLPVPLLFSQAVKEEEETIAVSKVNSFSSHTVEREEDPTKHVVDELRCDSSRQRKQDTRGRGGGGDGEDKPSEEEHRQHYLPLLRSRSPSPLNSIFPSPPHPHSLAEMSRIYNLKTVGSRTAVCMSERTMDRPIPSPSTKVQPQLSAAQKEPCSPERTVGRLTQKQLWVGGVALGSKASTSDEQAGFQTVQHQVEQLQLRDKQEVQTMSHDDNVALPSLSQKTHFKDRESQAEPDPRVPQNQPNNETEQEQPRQKDQQTPQSPVKCQSSPQLLSERTPQPKLAQSNQSASIAINSRPLLTPTPENALHPDRGVPLAPSSSPCSPTPSQSPSPSSSPSPTQFTIRSASGGKQVKRGTTITITPRKPVGGAAVEAVAVSSGPPAKTSAQAQVPVLTEVVETGKKRYPTAEEIEVIGGYQNLDKSCLVKSPKGTRKGVKVCFDDAQLEHVCEYPSESSLLASTPSLPSQEKARENEVQEEDEEERGPFVSRSRNVGTAAGLRVLRVDESCHR